MDLTLTPARARRLLGAARQKSEAAARAFGRDEISEAEFWKVLEHEENLRVFALTGERPA